MKGRILSGMRPTGRLHLGNYEGALRNWVALQEDYEMFCMIADWHALTTEYEHPQEVRKITKEVALDYVAAGLDPERVTIFVQSDVKQHAELHLLFSMITPTPWLVRNPTIKEQARAMGLIEDEEEVTKINYGLLGYPVLQAADILIYRADAVPVGEDQVPHIELTREIARRFNHLYGEFFPEPEPILTKVPRLPGLDGRKMSKSLGNVVYLSDPPDSVKGKVRTMFTDPMRIKKEDPGDPEVRGCPVFLYHKLYNPNEVLEIEEDCKAARLGCVECKGRLAEKLSEFLGPIQERRREAEAREGYIEEVLEEGARRARSEAEATMEKVRELMGLK
ncbi:MAG: tryptophan--tRNA ligase [Candidatus Latescibacterota bacterium]|nr:MAG: tryptophan--tRNA ligase [Candidatus Latescibacterota bacterium]